VSAVTKTPNDWTKNVCVICQKGYSKEST